MKKKAMFSLESSLLLGLAEPSNPKFIGPFQILKRIGPIAYQIALPPDLSNLHDVYHVSQFRKYCFDPSYIIEYDTMHVREDLTYETKSVQIIDISILVHFIYFKIMN